MFIVSCTKCTYVTKAIREEDVVYDIRMDGGRIEKDSDGNYKIECPLCACERLNISQKVFIVGCTECSHSTKVVQKNSVVHGIKKKCPNCNCEGLNISQKREHMFSVEEHLKQ